MMLKEQTRMTQISQKYNEFSKTAGLPAKVERLSSGISSKSLTKHRDNVIIKPAAKSAIRNTGKLVKYNPDASFRVSIPEYSDKLNTTISDACREVAKLGGKDGLEHLCLVDLTHAKIVYREVGDESSVGYSGFYAFLSEHPNSKFCFVHNHNTNGYFSEQDMRTLLRIPNIVGFTAVRLDGVIYHAVRTRMLGTSKLMDDIFQKELEPINAAVRKGEITAGQRTRMREEIIVDSLLQNYTKGLYEFE